MVRCFALLLALTLTAAPVAACTGDCRADGAVTIDELLNGVNIALGNMPVSVCQAADPNRSGSVAISELVSAVQAALNGCPVEPTATVTRTPTPTPVFDCEVDGVICTVAGTGLAQYDGDGRPALETSLYLPIDVTFDPFGQLLIMDWNNLLLRRLDPTGTLTTIMGIVNTEALPVDGALARDTPLHHASNVELDEAGRLYVAGDHVPVVFRVGTDNRVFTVAGTEDVGYSGDGGPALAARLTVPFGVLPDAIGGFYVSDVDAHVVRYIDPAGVIHTTAGTGEQGYGGDAGPGTNAQLSGPARLQFGPDGHLYFCETKSAPGSVAAGHVVRRLRQDGTIETVAGTGLRGYAGDGGPATAAQLDTPYDLAFAPNGDLYVADTGNNVIRRIATDGTISTVVGDGEPTFAGDGGPARDASLRRPSALAFDADGSLWIADTSNHRVRRVWRFLASVQ
jgi:hypothetical protein